MKAIGIAAGAHRLVRAIRRSGERRLAAQLLEQGKLTPSQFTRCVDAQVREGRRRGLISLLLALTDLSIVDIQRALETEEAHADDERNKTRTRISASDLGAGRRFGPFLLLRELGRGGMGTVYLARREDARGAVALKVLRPYLESSPDLVKRFLIEARSVAQMSHENIVRVHEIDRVDGRHYFTMEYVEGSTLGVLLRQRPARMRSPVRAEDRAWLRRGVRVMARVARALHHAHGLGVLHRDLKPDNVLLTRDLTPKVIDFGLSKSLWDANPSVTQPGSIIGTPDYMSPEQAGGEPSLGPETDVFSLGVILYELYAGRKPFDGGSVAATLNAILAKEPHRLSAVAPWTPPAVEAICSKAMAKEPRERYRTALAMALDLERHLAGRAVLAKTHGVWARFRSFLTGR